VNHGRPEDEYAVVRSDALFPTLYQIRQQGLFTTAVAYGTAHVAAQFIKFFPRDAEGVLAPEQLPLEIRRAILQGVRNRGIRLSHKITPLKPPEDDEEIL
jgi:hypothetical protein